MSYETGIKRLLPGLKRHALFAEQKRRIVFKDWFGEINEYQEIVGALQ